MGIFNFGRKYSKEYLQQEISVMEELFNRAIGFPSDEKIEIKQELLIQYKKVLDICRKGNFYGGETVKWNGMGTSLSNVTSIVQVFLEI